MPSSTEFKMLILKVHALKISIQNYVEKAFCKLDFNKTNSVTVIKWNFIAHFKKLLSIIKFIYDWYNKFKTVCVKVKILGDHHKKSNWSMSELVTNTTHRNSQGGTIG